ncbi:MAG: ribosomal protein L13e, partial [Promethearchaeota archaeon]
MSEQIKKSPSSIKMLIAFVKKPKKHLKSRKGRGFSLNEIKSAAISLDRAKKLPISIDFRRKSTHDENAKKLSALYREIVAMKSEDKIKLDLSNKEAFKAFKQLKGIKSIEAKLLIEAGIRSLSSLIEEEPSSLSDDTKIGIGKIEKWIEQAKNLLKKKKIMKNIDELLQVKGM